MTQYVLVHGSWHDGSFLKPVADALHALGHRAFAPTVAGHGPGANPDVSLDDGVRSITDLFVRLDLRDVVLVGHSLGGTIIARVSEEIPDRIAALVFWSAFVPGAGRSIFDEVSPGREAIADADRSGDAVADVLAPEVWQDVFLPGVDDELIASTYERLSPEPRRPKSERLELRRFYASSIPKRYIHATDDRALPPGLDRTAMLARLPDAREHTVAGGHEVMLTDPAGIAEVIVEAGRP